MKTTSSSLFQWAAEVLDPPRNPGSTTTWWRWWWRTPAGLRLCAAGVLCGGGEARVWGEGGAGHLRWCGHLMLVGGGRPPPLGPHYIGGSPKCWTTSLRIRPEPKTFHVIGKPTQGGNPTWGGIPPFHEGGWPATLEESTLDSSPLGLAGHARWSPFGTLLSMMISSGLF